MEIREDALLIANTGQPFDPRGVVSICASHLGTKLDFKPYVPDSGCSDSNLINKIKEQELRTYKNDPNRIFRDYNNEDQTWRDYGDRAIWELLQNADDAMAPKNTSTANLIGSKGLGFKSVLEITNEPEIYSGPFYFRFSSKETQKILRQKLDREPPPLTFQIPHKIPPDKKIKRVDELLQSYSTVIRLPFKDNAKEKALQWLENLSPRFLLFCQYIEQVKIHLPGDKIIVWTIERESPGKLVDANFLIEDTFNKTISRYRRWAETWPCEQGKRHSVAICLEVDGQNRIIPLNDTPFLHVFFETEEFLPYHALIHASFDLNQSRKQVVNFNEDVFNHFEKLIERATDEIPPGVILKTLIPREEINENNKLAIFLKKRIDSVLKKKHFIPCMGGGKSTPEKAKLWDRALGLGEVTNPDIPEISNELLVDSDINNNALCRKALEYLGSEELQGRSYPRLLRYCFNHSRQSCEKTIKTLFSIVNKYTSSYWSNERKEFLNECRLIPCWWIDKNIAISLSGDKPLLKESPKKELPSLLEVDILDAEFNKTVEELKENESTTDETSIRNDSWNDLLKRYLLDPKKDTLVHHVLVPELEKYLQEKSWWEQHGFEVFNFYLHCVESIKFDNISPVIWDDKERSKLARALLLPTNKGWLPAWQCYASKEWRGLLKEEILSDVKDRGLLLPPGDWPVNDLKDKIESWKGPLQYAGVSWEPKVLHFESIENPAKFESGKPPNPWEPERKWDYHNDYCNSLNPETYYDQSRFDCDARLKEQWAIEFFPELLPKSGNERIKIMRHLIEKDIGNNQMRFSYKKRGEKNETNFLKSLAKHQCFNVAWLPCKESLLHNNKFITPRDAYMPKMGLNGFLPEVDISIPEGQEGRDIATFLTRDSGVREKLPSDDSWVKWLTDLPRVVTRVIKEDAIKKVVRSVYNELFQKFSECPSWINTIPTIPCMTWDEKNKSEKIEFVGRHNVHWLDEPSLADTNTRFELAKKFDIFLFELEDGRKAYEWFCLKKLSEAVNVKPVYEVINEEKEMTDEILKQYKE